MFGIFAARPRLSPRLPVLLGLGRLLRAGHGPSPADLRGGPGRPARARSRDPPAGRRPGPLRPRSRRRCSRTRAPGSCTSAIFWGFVLLTIGTANIVTGGAHPGRPPAARSAGSSGPPSRRCRTSSPCSSLVAVGYAFVRRLITRPRRLAFTRGALIILVMIGGVVATELLAQAFEAARYGRLPGAFVANALADPARPTRAGHRSTAPSSSCGGPTSRSWPRSWCTCRSASTSTSRPCSSTSTSASWRRAASCRRWTSRPRTRRSGCGRCRTSAGRTSSTGSPAPSAGAAPMPARPTGPASRSTRSEMIMGLRHMAVDAEHGLDLIPNSPIVRTQTTAWTTDARAERCWPRPIVDDAIPYDAVWDCVTCGACVEACPVLIEHVDKIVGFRRNLVLEDSRFPSELTGAFRNMETAGNPWGQPRSTRTDWTKGLAVRGADRGRPGRGRVARRDRGPVLGRLRGRLRRAQPEGRPGVRDAASTPPGFASRSSARRSRAPAIPARRMGNEYVYQMLAGGQRRDAQPLRDEPAHDRDRLPALLQHDRQRVRPVRRALPRSSTTASTSRTCWHRGGCGTAEAGGGADRAVTLHDCCYMARYNDVDRRPARRPRSLAGARAARDGAERQEHVLLRRGRRPDVDGGDPRHPDQRRADAPGAGDRGRGRGHELPVLHDDDEGRPGRGRGERRRRGRARPTSPSCWPTASPRTLARRSRPAGSCRSCSSEREGTSHGRPAALPPLGGADRAARRGPQAGRREDRAARRRGRPFGRVPLGQQGAPRQPGHPGPAVSRASTAASAPTC